MSDTLTSDELRPIRKCLDCEHVVDRKPAPRWWLCIRHPRAPGEGFVTDQPHDKDEPYGRCRDMNLGFCPLWEPRRDGQMSLATGGK